MQLMNDGWMDGWNGWYGFNVGQAKQRAFADGLRFNPKTNAETVILAVLILRQVARPSLCQGTHRGIIDMAPTKDFTCTRRPWCTWWSVVSDEAGTFALWSQVQSYTNQVTTTPLWNASRKKEFVVMRNYLKFSFGKATEGGKKKK